MSRTLLLILTLISLSACATATSDPAPRFKSVPLVEYSREDQDLADRRIREVCGSPPACPSGSILERMVLDYGRLRGMIRSIEEASP